MSFLTLAEVVIFLMQKKKSKYVPAKSTLHMVLLCCERPPEPETLSGYYMKMEGTREITLQWVFFVVVVVMLVHCCVDSCFASV